MASGCTRKASTASRWLPSARPRASSASSSKQTLGDQDHRTGGLASLEVAVRLRRVVEPVLLRGLDLHLARLDHVEQVVRALHQVGARRDVGGERGARDVERALAGEDAEVL